MVEEELILTEQILDSESFEQFMRQQKMMEKSIEDYNRYHQYVKKNFTNTPFTQETINVYFSGRDTKGTRIIYLSRNNSLPGRAYLRKFIDYIKINKIKFNLTNEQMSCLSNLIIPKITGRTEDYLHSVALDADERKKMRQTIKALKILNRKRFTKIQLMYYLSIYGGFRRNELVNVKIRDIKINEYKRNLLTKREPNLEIEITKGKGNKKRIVVIPGKYFELLRSYMKILKSSDYFITEITKEDITNKNYFLFPHTTANKWLDELKYVAMKAGVRQSFYNRERVVINPKTKEKTLDIKNNVPTSTVHPHDLRATCADMLSKRGVPIDVIRIFLGHDNITTTQLYLSPDISQIKSLYESKM